MANIIDEPDRLPGASHPREAKMLVGHHDAQAAILDGLRAGSLHHAWLVGGPEGIGKATFAYMAAKMLLGLSRTGAPPEGELLRVDSGSSAARLVETRAHPDLAVLRREHDPDKKRVATVIGVDAVRRTLDVFGSTAGSGGWRVCIVDSAEDLHGPSANALLKLLEEPPPRSIFFVLAHQPQHVLPTIRSRCRKLALHPLSPAQVTEVLALQAPPATPADIARAVALADGAPRRALARLEPETLALIDGARALLAQLPVVDIKAVAGLAESLSGRAAEEDFAVFMETVQVWMSRMLADQAALGPGRLAPLAELWEKMTRSAREADVFNIDRRPLVLSIFTELASIVARMRTA
jgi:DNA polymerase-3 subunit delta'